MRRLLVLSFTALMCLLAVLPTELPAADGAIPIWEPTTITQPGKYRLTRDITRSGPGPAITIASDHVDLDLNGFTVKGEGGINGTGITGVSIHSGTVIGVDGASIGLYNASEVVVRSCVVKNEANETAIAMDGANAVIANNVVGGPGLLNDTGLAIIANAVTIRGNSLLNANISVEGDGCLIQGNVVAKGGLRVSGSRNKLEDNTVTDHGVFGLRFLGSSSDNVYRNNTCRGNSGIPEECSNASATTEFCDEGINNTSGGGNFMPDEM